MKAEWLVNRTVRCKGANAGSGWGTRWAWKKDTIHKWELWEFQNLEFANITMFLEFSHSKGHWKTKNTACIKGKTFKNCERTNTKTLCCKDNLFLTEHKKEMTVPQRHSHCGKRGSASAVGRSTAAENSGSVCTGTWNRAAGISQLQD